MSQNVSTTESVNKYIKENFEALKDQVKMPTLLSFTLMDGYSHPMLRINEFIQEAFEYFSHVNLSFFKDASTMFIMIIDMADTTEEVVTAFIDHLNTRYEREIATFPLNSLNVNDEIPEITEEFYII